MIDSFNFQDVFHSTVHWLKASGITQKLVDDYMNAEPYIPLPKKSKNKPLVLEQLIMLWNHFHFRLGNWFAGFFW